MNSQQPQQQHLLQALALLLQKCGTRIDGGYEVYIPDDLIAEMSPYGQIQEQHHLTKSGICLRYFPNQTIDQTLEETIDDTAKGGALQCPQADDQNPA